MLKNELKQLAVAIIVNGTIAVLIWLVYACVKFACVGFTDVVLLWFIASIAVGVFISLICQPFFTYFKKTQSVIFFPLSGASLGMLSVLVFFVVASPYPVNLEYLLYRIWLYCLIFSIFGAVYGVMYSKRQTA